MDLKEKIEKQINAGFTAQQVYENLMQEGYSKNEIDAEFKYTAAEIIQERKPNTKNILFGCLFILIVIFRIARYSSTNSTLSLISIFTGLFLAIYFFVKKN